MSYDADRNESDFWESIKKGLADEKKLNLELELSQAEVKTNEYIEPPKIALKIGESIISTLGNITTIIGKAKSRKSFAIIIAIAVALCRDYTFGLFKSHLPRDKRMILLFDTEQSRYHVKLGLMRICKMVGIESPENLKVYGLRKYSNSERAQIIEHAVYNTPNLGMVFIDGAKDICLDFMSPEHSNDTVSKLMKWTEELDITVVTVLHQNKSDTNARGHLGTELMNKSETVLSVSKSEADAKISIVESVACRNIDFDPFAFEINEDGIPIEAEDFTIRTATKKNPFDIADIEDYKKYQLLTDVFSKNKELGRGELMVQLKIAFKNKFSKDIGNNGLEALVVECKNNNWIVQEARLKPWSLGAFNNTEEETVSSSPVFLDDNGIPF